MKKKPRKESDSEDSSSDSSDSSSVESRRRSKQNSKKKESVCKKSRKAKNRRHSDTDKSSTDSSSGSSSSSESSTSGTESESEKERSTTKAKNTSETVQRNRKQNSSVCIIKKGKSEERSLSQDAIRRNITVRSTVDRVKNCSAANAVSDEKRRRNSRDRRDRSMDKHERSHGGRDRSVDKRDREVEKRKSRDHIFGERDRERDHGHSISGRGDERSRPNNQYDNRNHRDYENNRDYRNRYPERQDRDSDRYPERQERVADRYPERQDRASERYPERQERVADRHSERQEIVADRYSERKDRGSDRYPERQERGADHHDYGNKRRYNDRNQYTRSPKRERRSDDRDRKYSPIHQRSWNRQQKRRNSYDDNKSYEWGKPSDNEKPKEPPIDPANKEKPNFALSGALTEDANKVNGVVIKYAEPPEARKPKRRWRLYPFKGETALPTLHIHRQSCFLVGRDRKVVDLAVDHPSCSKQHAVLQYRLVPFDREDGTTGKRVRLYLLDLESANGTFLNNKKIDARKYYELIEKDVIKFGFSTREYVLLHENSKEDQEDDDVDVKLEPAEPAQL